MAKADQKYYRSIRNHTDEYGFREDTAIVAVGEDVIETIVDLLSEEK